MNSKKYIPKIEYKIFIISLILVLDIFVFGTSIIIISFNRFFLLGLMIGSFIGIISLLISSFFTKLMLDNKKAFYSLISYLIKIAIIILPLLALINFLKEERIVVISYIIGYFMLSVSTIISVNFFSKFIFNKNDYKKMVKEKSKSIFSRPIKFEYKTKEKTYKTFSRFIIYKKK